MKFPTCLGHWLGLLLVITWPIGEALAQKQPARTERLFVEVEQLIDSAQQVEAPTYAPTFFQEVIQSYEHAVATFQSTEYGSEELTQQLERSRKLALETLAQTDFVKESLADLIQTREFATNCEYVEQEPGTFEEAEKQFDVAIDLANQANRNDQLLAQATQKAEDSYRTVVVKALMLGPYAEAEQNLRMSRRQMAEAEYQDATRSLERMALAIDSLRNPTYQLAIYVPRWIDRLGDIRILPPGPLLPDTLMMGAFTIVMERYESRGWYSYSAGIQRSVTGYGRIQFDCEGASSISILPPEIIWQGRPLQGFTFTVVDTIRDPETEMTLEEAQCLFPKTIRGNVVTVPLPTTLLNPQLSYTRRAYLDQLLDWAILPRRSGIRVRFDGEDILLSISPNKGRIISGSAYYPTHPPVTNVPTPPATLTLDGFMLEMDSIVLTPARGQFKGGLVLHNSLKDRTNCAPPKLPLGWTDISPFCEFYKALPDAAYGPMTVGETPVVIEGRGYVADFTGFRRYNPLGEPNSWEGVILLDGTSGNHITDTITANDGYLQAPYVFPLATVRSKGLDVVMKLNPTASPFYFRMLQPYGYAARFEEATIILRNSALNAGELRRGDIICPLTAVRTNSGNHVVARFERLDVLNDHDIIGSVTVTGTINWGEWGNRDINQRFYRTNISDPTLGAVYFSGKVAPVYYPLKDNNFRSIWSVLASGTTIKDAYIQGVTLANFDNVSIFTSHTPDGSPIRFNPFPGRFLTWMNIASKGVHGEVFTYLQESGSEEVGPTGSDLYASDDPFQIVWGAELDDTLYCRQYIPGFDQYGSYATVSRRYVPDITPIPCGQHFHLQFVESAVFNGDWTAYIDLPYPIGNLMRFTDMMTSSIADVAGGIPDLSTPLELTHWGVELEESLGFSSAGIISARTGQVVMTAAGISEERHFSRPFQLTWGELLPDGNLGRLFFNYHTGGQTFDGFHYVPTAVALSPYDATNDVASVYQLTGGTIQRLGANFRINNTALVNMSIAGVPVNMRNILDGSMLKDRFYGRAWDFRQDVRSTLADAGISDAAIDAQMDDITASSQTKAAQIPDEEVLRNLDEIRESRELRIGRPNFVNQVRGAIGNGNWSSYQTMILNEAEVGGFLEVGGRTHFPFYGGEYHHIADIHYLGNAGSPFNNRFVQLLPMASGDFGATDYDIYANWIDGLGEFDYTIDYNEVAQDGFVGLGEAVLAYMTGGGLPGEVALTSRGICMSIAPPTATFRGVSMGPVANLTSLSHLWGCACLSPTGQLRRVVVGGEAGASGNFSILARGGTTLSATLEITPTTGQLAMDGLAYLSLAANTDLEADAHLRLLVDTENNFTEGDIGGHFRIVSAPGFPTMSSGLEGDGQLNWHVGGPSADTYQLLQGNLSLQVLGIVKAGASSGFFVGINAPKDRAWVLRANNSLYALNTSAMPNRLTGFYGYMQHSTGIDIGILSGGTEMFLGLGGFVDIGTADGAPSIAGLPFVVGNLGGRIYGDILWGFVSASAGYNLQAIAPYPASFQGTVRLRGCVLWVACKSVNLTIGANSSDGFYVH